MTDMVNKPPHYRSHKSGVECIQITEHMNFNLGNVIKYVWRADEKGCATEDLKKAAWYLQREIERRNKDGKETIAYCLRCGLPHPADQKCLRDNEIRQEVTWDAHEQREAVARTVETLAQAAQFIDRLLDQNAS